MNEEEQLNSLRVLHSEQSADIPILKDRTSKPKRSIFAGIKKSKSIPLGGWKDRQFKIVILVLRFITIITKSSFASSFKLIKQSVFNMIGDQSADFEYYLMKNYFKYEKAQSLHRLGYFINQKYCNFKKNSILAQLYDIDLILLPESLFVLFWNLYIILMINCSVFYISIKFAFDLDNRPSDYRYSRNMLLYVLPLIAFVLEILIKFNLSFYRKGALITERSLIREKYIKEDFLLDSIVILSQMMYQFGGVHYFDLVVLTKITQMPRLFETLLDKLELTLNSMAIYDFFRLIYLIIVACHFCTCCWFYIGIMEVGSSWLTVQQIIDADWIVFLLEHDYHVHHRIWIPESIHKFFKWTLPQYLPSTNDGLEVYNPLKSPLNREVYAAWHQKLDTTHPHTLEYRLVKAICDNDLNEAKLAIDEYPPILNARLQDGFTALSLSSSLNRPAFIDYFLLRGAQIDEVDGQGRTPLIQAVINWQIESIKVLAERGADAHKKGSYGYTAIDLAQKRNYEQIHTFLQFSADKHKKSLPPFTFQLEIEKKLDLYSKVFVRQQLLKIDPVKYPFNDFKGQYKVHYVQI